MLKEVILPRSIVRVPQICGFYEVEDDVVLYIQSPEPPEIEFEVDDYPFYPHFISWIKNIYVPRESYEKYHSNNAWNNEYEEINLKAYKYR